MMRQLTRFLSVGLLISAAACGKGGVDDFRAGVPSDGAVQMKAPQKAGAVVGDTSFWWGATFAATTGVNTGVLAVLDLIHNVVEQPPTSHPSANVYVWGPGNGSPLDPNVYRLTVTDDQNGTYDYKLEAKGKNDADTAFVAIITGQHTPVVTNGVNDKDHGSGDFTLNWDARKTLAAAPQDAQGRPLQGNWVVAYDHKTADVSVDVNFNNILDSNGNLVNATYHYSQLSGADGKFQFSTQANVDTATAALEQVTVESRWKQDGSGRSDITISGGDVAAGAAGQGSECWDTNFKESFGTITLPSGAGNYTEPAGGDQASLCAFASAEYYTAG
ncbi:MAG: hypothetical protein JST54_23450 [Deltaproteobacteria bacterium]|nr:hypothetical protein [Deltaproteobacteria bacterium]